MRLADLPLPLREALALFDMLRRLGFSNDDIYLAPSRTMLQVVLRAQGKEWVCDAGVPNLSMTKVLELWAEAGAAWNHDATPEERRALLRETDIGGRGLELIVSLSQKGFRLPGSGSQVMLLRRLACTRKDPPQ